MGIGVFDNDTVYLITGAAGFIGFHMSKRLLNEGRKIIGVDNINDYYDVKLKYARLKKLERYPNFTFIQADISDKAFVLELFNRYRPDYVINLAAQAGVRYSLENPDVYIQSNIIGFYNILEACHKFTVKHLLYASSSSVYGANKKVPFEETDFVDKPVSLYAATKKSNELMAYTYSQLYKIPTTGLRFFTVYGPMGRPDMAYYSFTEKYFKGDSIRVYNSGNFDQDLYRDFTYIDDIVEGIVKLIGIPPDSETPYTIYNLGNNHPEKLMEFINTLEEALTNSLGRKVSFKKIFEAPKPGDVPVTYASTNLLQEAVGFKPITSIKEGLQKFTDWFVDYYQLI